MLISPEKLPADLERRGLAPGYLVFGDEPLQVMESADAIRAAARAAGIGERLIFEVEAGFDWQQLLLGANELSLFAERRLIEIRLRGRKPDKAGGAILADLLARADVEDVLLLSAEKIDRNAQKSKWFKAIDSAGVVVQARQIAARQLDRWIQERARRYKLTLTAAAAELIAVRAEGNLLAAAQELDKLALLVDGGEVNAEMVLGAMVDSARFDVFSLIDVTLAGDAAKAVRMLRGLREEGTEAVVIGWAVNRELRTLLHIAAAVAAGKPVAAVLNEHNVWSSRTGIVRRALDRSPLPRLRRLFEDSIRLDRIIKGAALGDPWDELELLCLRLATR
ncbi:MAG: DNA polymerase III subunit delta [Gammaproteobacteria bacterium]|jgi:DNA polymerase-3 subunit delta